MTTTPISLTYAIPKSLIPQWDYFDNHELLTTLILQWIKLAIKLNDQKIKTYITVPGFPEYTDQHYIDNFIQLAVTIWKLLPKNVLGLKYINTLDDRIRFNLVFDGFNKWEQSKDVKDLSYTQYIELYPKPNKTNN